MYQVTNRIPVREEHGEAFEARFKARLGRLADEPGFIRNAVLRPVRKPDQPAYYLVQTLWETEAHFRAWLGSDSFREAHANPPPREWFEGANVLELHEVVFIDE